jgi:hypothetical protein
VAEHQRFIMGGVSVGMSVGTSGGWMAVGSKVVASVPSPLKFGLDQLSLHLPLQSQKLTDVVLHKGVDNAVQFTIVSPSGQHITANAYGWALRGGGAGSWDIISSVTYNNAPCVVLK